jgi:hypothetical protein
MTSIEESAGRNRTEIDQLWPYIERTLARMMAVVEGCSVEQLNWRPPAPGTSSIFTLATHTLSNARVNTIGVLCGQPIERDRDAEFQAVATESNASLPEWPAIRDELAAAVGALDDEAMNRRCTHPVRGEVTGREVLMLLARHAAEHVGHAELTRDLAIAAGVR